MSYVQTQMMLALLNKMRHARKATIHRMAVGSVISWSMLGVLFWITWGIPWLTAIIVVISVFALYEESRKIIFIWWMLNEEKRVREAWRALNETWVIEDPSAD